VWKDASDHSKGYQTVNLDFQNLTTSNSGVVITQAALEAAGGVGFASGGLSTVTFVWMSTWR